MEITHQPKDEISTSSSVTREFETMFRKVIGWSFWPIFLRGQFIWHQPKEGWKCLEKNPAFYVFFVIKLIWFVEKDGSWISWSLELEKNMICGSHLQPWAWSARTDHQRYVDVLVVVNVVVVNVVVNVVVVVVVVVVHVADVNLAIINIKYLTLEEFVHDC